MAHRQISPGNARHLHAYVRRIYVVAFRASTGLCRYWPAHPATPPHPISVRRTSALPAASFRFAVTRDTLAVRLTLPLAGCVEDFHLQVNAPCRAQQQDRLRVARPVEVPQDESDQIEAHGRRTPAPSSLARLRATVAGLSHLYARAASRKLMRGDDRGPALSPPLPLFFVVAEPVAAARAAAQSSVRR
jgi:hypothetical protein